MTERSSPFHSLPKTANKGEIAKLLRRAIELILVDYTYKELASRMNARGHEVTEDGLKQFVFRSETKTPNKDNQTLAHIYDYFHNIHDQKVDVRALVMSNWSLFKGEHCDPNFNSFTRAFYIMICRWLSIDIKDAVKTESKIKGEYVILRKSIRDPNVIVKSHLSIRLEEKREYIEATHIHSDRHNAERASRGLAVILGLSIHIFLQIEDGKGIELISLRDPIQTRFKKLMGFMISMDIDRKLLSARVCVARNTLMWDKLSSRFRVSDLDEYPKIKKWALGLLDADKAQSLSDLEEPDDGE